MFSRLSHIKTLADRVEKKKTRLSRKVHKAKGA